MKIGKEKKQLSVVLEDLFIFMSIFALWPIILGWQGWVWVILKYLALVGLIWIFFQRIKRYRSGQEVKQDSN